MSKNKDTFTNAANNNHPLRAKPATMDDMQTRILLSTHRDQLIKDLVTITIARQNASSDTMADCFDRALRMYRMRQYIHPSRFDDTDILLKAAGEYNHVNNQDMLDSIFERLELCAQKLTIEPHQITRATTAWHIAAKNTAFQIDRFKQWQETVFAKAIREKHKNPSTAKQELISQFVDKKGIVSIQTIRKDSQATLNAHQSLSAPSWELKRSKIVTLSAFR